MKRQLSVCRLLAPVLAAALIGGMALPARAWFWDRGSRAPYVEDFTKTVPPGDILAFAAEDFVVQTGNRATLNSIAIQSLPDPGAGILALGGEPLAVGTVVDRTALAGLRFQTAREIAVKETTFTFLPSFSSGEKSRVTTVTIRLQDPAAEVPIARNMDLSTYRNIAVTGYFDAAGGGETLRFQLTSHPARGAITLPEDGSSRFVYTPYANKTGRDSFTYVAVDPEGNRSEEATVTVRIERPRTQVTYADLADSPLHRAAIHLAERGVYVGQKMGKESFFCPEQGVDRARFLTMALDAVGLEPMEGVTLTAFADDESIPAWAKGAVSAALRAGAIRGSRSEGGAPVFDSASPITRGEAAVMLDRLLGLAQAPVETFAGGAEGHWAAQAAADLAACGVLSPAQRQEMDAALTLGDAAELLDGALTVVENR